MIGKIQGTQDTDFVDERMGGRVVRYGCDWRREKSKREGRAKRTRVAST